MTAAYLFSADTRAGNHERRGAGLQKYKLDLRGTEQRQFAAVLIQWQRVGTGD